MRARRGPIPQSPLPGLKLPRDRYPAVNCWAILNPSLPGLRNRVPPGTPESHPCRDARKLPVRPPRNSLSPTTGRPCAARCQGAEMRRATRSANPWRPAMYSSPPLSSSTAQKSAKAARHFGSLEVFFHGYMHSQDGHEAQASCEAHVRPNRDGRSAEWRKMSGRGSGGSGEVGILRTLAVNEGGYGRIEPTGGGRGRASVYAGSPPHAQLPAPHPLPSAPPLPYTANECRAVPSRSYAGRHEGRP